MGTRNEYIGQVHFSDILGKRHIMFHFLFVSCGT